MSVADTSRCVTDIPQNLSDSAKLKFKISMLLTTSTAISQVNMVLHN